MKILKVLKIIPWCKQIYGPWIVSSGKKSNTTTIGSDRRRIWSNHIFLFQTFVKQTFERSLGFILKFFRKSMFWKSWKSTQVVGKFVCINSIHCKKRVQQNSSSRRADHHGVLSFCWRPFFKAINCKWSYKPGNIYKNFQDS